ncbi:MAG: ribosome hibernation-promoting factor, HPF/YfiA family [Nitrospiraceae bacterium]
MRIIITGRHVEITAALRRHIESRMKRLERYGMKLGDVQVVLAVEKYRHTAEVVFNFNGVAIQGKTSTTEMYASIDQLLDKVSRQILKRKEKLVSHKRKAVEPIAVRQALPSARRSLEFDTVRPPLYELTPAQAVSRLGRQPSALLIFKDLSTDRMQVMRRLDNGNIELIDPQPV